VEVGEVFANRRTGAMVEVLAWPEIAGPSAVKLRRVYAPGMGFRVPHVHLLIDETFRVEYGVADFWIGHRPGRLAEGQEFRVPRYEVHLGPLNRSRSDLMFTHTLEAVRTTHIRRYAETLARYVQEGRDVHGDLPPMVAAAIFAGKDQQTVLPVLPQGFQRNVLFPLARTLESRRQEYQRHREQRAKAASDAWEDW
jgi:mannose-6-phosphate isomerase-like protein (cupin superfamily)